MNLFAGLWVQHEREEDWDPLPSVRVRHAVRHAEAAHQSKRCCAEEARRPRRTGRQDLRLSWLGGFFPGQGGTLSELFNVGYVVVKIVQVYVDCFVVQALGVSLINFKQGSRVRAWWKEIGKLCSEHCKNELMHICYASYNTYVEAVH